MAEQKTPNLPAVSDLSYGFTIVELITVVLLLGVLSAVAFGRLGSTNAFEPAILTQQIDEQLRVAQKLATARQDGQITFSLSLVGGEWQTLTASSVAGTLYTSSTKQNNSTILATSGATVATLDSSTALVLQLDGLGDLSNIAIGAATTSAGLGVELLVSGDTSRSLCIYGSGYVAHNVCS